jgi:4a-hydroxytetrahydrobiopterin dehydratase
MKLSEEKCARIEKGQRPLSEGEAAGLSREVDRWALRGAGLEREFGFKGFGEAMEFVNRVAGVAAAEDHHPDICVSYNKVSLKLSTHKIGGLTRNDFIMAAKIDELGEP